jgi:hypothetical protein
MKRLFVALCGLSLLTACGGTVTTSGPPLGSGALPTNLVSAAVDQLCSDQDPASLSQLATDLDAVDTDTDTSDVESTVATVLGNLQRLETDATSRTVRDAAVVALEQLQTAIKDPQARENAVKGAVDALRAADAALCQ